MEQHSHFAAMIRRHFPDVAAETLVELPHPGWGGDSDAFLVDGVLVFRFPRRPPAPGALATEVCLLPRLAPRVPLRVPGFRYVAFAPGKHDRADTDPASGAPDHVPLFVGYPLIEGVPLTPDLFRSAAADPATLERMAAQLGGFLTGLHTFPLDDAESCGVRPPAPAISQAVERQYEAVRASVYPTLDSEERGFLDRLFAAYLGDPCHFAQPPALCHGDLTSDHILLGPREERPGIAGVIDFGDVVVGDTAGDFVWRFEYGERFFRRAIDHYGVPLADPEAFARVVAFRHRLMPVGEIAHGLEVGNAGYVAEGRRALRAHMDAGR